MKDGLCSCCDFTVRCHMIPPYVAWAQVKSGKQTECQGKSHIIATLSFHITWPFNHSNVFFLLANSHFFLLFCYQYWYIYTHTTCTAVWKTEFFYITLERDLFCSMYMTCELLRGWHSTAHWSYTKSAGHIYSLHCCVTYVKQTNKLYLLYVYVTGIEEA